jgi:hypothetical protein
MAGGVVGVREEDTELQCDRRCRGDVRCRGEGERASTGERERMGGRKERKEGRKWGKVGGGADQLDSTKQEVTCGIVTHHHLVTCGTMPR